MQNSMAVFTFPVLDGKDHFQANLAKKKSKLSVSYQDQLEHGEFNAGIHFLRFRWETPFLVYLHKKSQNCYFQLKFATNINANFSNLMVVLTFSTLDGNHPFYANLVGNIKLFSLSFNFFLRPIKNLNTQNPVVVFTFSFLFFFFFFFFFVVRFFLFQMQNSVVVFTYSVLNWKHAVCLNLVQQFNIVSLSGSLVPRLI